MLPWEVWLWPRLRMFLMWCASPQRRGHSDLCKQESSKHKAEFSKSHEARCRRLKFLFSACLFQYQNFAAQLWDSWVVFVLQTFSLFKYGMLRRHLYHSCYRRKPFIFYQHKPKSLFEYKVKASLSIKMVAVFDDCLSVPIHFAGLFAACPSISVVKFSLMLLLYNFLNCHATQNNREHSELLELVLKLYGEEKQTIATITSGNANVNKTPSREFGPYF